MQLTTILDELLNYAIQAQPVIEQCLQSGYDRAAIEHIVPFTLPDEVLELYNWHNGTPDTDATRDVNLFYYHRFLPLEEAYQTYQALMQVNVEIEVVIYK